MIIDNKTPYNNHGIVTVEDFIKKYSEPSQNVVFDIVTGFFSIYGLLFLKRLHDNYHYRLVLARMVNDAANRDHIIDLLQEDNSIDAILKLRFDAKEAIDFIQQQTVEIKTVTKAFCHAKTYIYHDTDERKQYYITGSSNLTEAGLGIKFSPNIEMNVAQHSETEIFKDISKWFEELWTKNADDVLELDSGEKITVKDYIISQIKKFFKDYTPEEIYYKILFELFQRDILLGDTALSETEMKHLRDSEIWNTLYDYQKSGVISLIRMLQKYGGAILADAVGLGKTFSALAVMLYFQNNGYKVLMLCPKKLQQNWEQYQREHDSRFEKDSFDYTVRFHTDLQNDRLETAYDRAKLSFLKKQKKLLIVIDESHNLRNDKSNRYKYLVDNLLDDNEGKKEIKVLLLSATPINNGLKDVRNQFNLIGRNNDAAFDTDEFQIKSLLSLFSEAQKKFTKWCENDNRRISDFINLLPQKFFNLTDRLIVARTRKIIEKTLGEKLAFPHKDKPQNVYKCLDKFGKYKNTVDIYDALMKLSLTAYQPSQYVINETDKKDWQDNRFREHFLVKMMTILFLKRLESSWYSCYLTIGKVLDIHKETLTNVEAFVKRQSSNPTINAEVIDDENDESFTLNKGTVSLADMGENINAFIANLKADIKKLQEFYDNLIKYKDSIESGKTSDDKLTELKNIITKKQTAENKKVLIFTAYSDTAEYIFENFKKAGFKNFAMISGTAVKDSTGESFTNFKAITERFSPYSKLYLEKDYSDIYQENLSGSDYYDEEMHRWKVPFDVWKNLVKEHCPEDYKKLAKPIDILIATDCLSEGQNLQDADMVINYDIHWNPVRLIQRFGRIDRLGSKNTSIRAVNFWPTPSFDAFINLTNRINDRMAAMVLANTETVQTDERLAEMIKDNPIADKNAEKLLRQLEENSIDDLEDNPQAFSFADLSLEIFRQDLLEYLEKNKDHFRNMPCGIFSGFKTVEDIIPCDGLVAVVGYPKKTDKRHSYSELYLMLQPSDSNRARKFAELNVPEILQFLRRHKGKERYVPKWLDEESNPDKIKGLSDILRQWMTIKAPYQVQNTIADMLSGNFTPKYVDESEVETTIENKFRLENFDLVVWEYVTNKL